MPVGTPPIKLSIANIESKPPPPESLLVDLSAASDAGNADALSVIVDDEHHAPVTHADAPLVLVASELFAPRGAGIFSQRENFAVYPGKQRIVQRVQFPAGRGLYFEGVFSHADDGPSNAWPGIARRECRFPCGAIRKPGHPRSPPK